VALVELDKYEMLLFTCINYTLHIQHTRMSKAIHVTYSSKATCTIHVNSTTNNTCIWEQFNTPAWNWNKLYFLHLVL